MLFSRACEHGLRAMIFVASKAENGGPAPIREIAEALDIPAASLAKVVQKLTRRGLLSSQKGPGGGIALARPAGEVSLLEVVEALEDRSLTGVCILGIPGCSQRTDHCPLHEQWSGVRERLVRMLEERTVGTVSDQLKDGTFVLARDIAGGSRSGRGAGAKGPARE
jgi:Rrf2 family iron-sulfur cluster assembly transcriptional regulator